MKYKVKVILTLEKDWTIEANSPKEAHQIAENKWEECDLNEEFIPLDNYTEHEIYITND